MENIVFIGMPGCGKSTISTRVAEALNRPWFDSDLEIEAREHMTISEIFAQKGEEYFRKRETECLIELSEKQGAVIAVGGGAAVRNGDILRKNAKVIYLFRSIASIAATLERDRDTRPLLRDKDALSTLYTNRRALYERLSDIIIENEGSIETTIQRVLEGIK